jgi:hypothetical protein
MRPKLASRVIVVRTAITLREGDDDDLISAFERVPARRRSAFIKAGLRTGTLQVDLGDLPDDDDLAESLDNFLM